MTARPALNDKVIIITGGGKGIGRDCALAYAREGAQVAVLDVDGDAALETVRGLEGRGLAVTCDVSEGDAVDAAVDRVLSEFGRIDAVHNNAGIALPAKPLHETTEAEWEALHRINLKSVYFTTRAAYPELRIRKGSILNTASMVGLLGQEDHAAYVATKGGMIALTKAMALDYATDGVRVNAVCPASVWTPMLREWVGHLPHPTRMERYFDEMHALGYCPEGDVIADPCVFLLSDQARFITGCILPVSGGAELGYRRHMDPERKEDAR